jgi:hypothetical protein
LLGVSSHSQKDSWIAFLIGMTSFLPILYIYARLRYPGLNLLEICLKGAWKSLGRFVIVLCFVRGAFGAQMLTA